MTPNPILKVLSVLNKHRVKYLLIGGQACIIYGAAEFSRDSDFVILSDPDNLARTRKALAELKAVSIYVPPLDERYLERGHACHFRCGGWDVKGLRVDIMSKLRGCDGFEELWMRREKLSLKNGFKINIINLQDLVQSKKTQRDKDWLMLKRLVDNDIILRKYKAGPERIRWWFSECRSAGMLMELAGRYRQLAKESAKARSLISSGLKGDTAGLSRRIAEEEAEERKKDINYWMPLRRELEALRRQRSSRKNNIYS